MEADAGITKRAMDALTGWRAAGPAPPRAHPAGRRARHRPSASSRTRTRLGRGGGGGGAPTPAFRGCIPCGGGRVLVLRVRHPITAASSGAPTRPTFRHSLPSGCPGLREEVGVMLMKGFA